MKPDLKPEHAWLGQLAGAWDYKGSCGTDDNGQDLTFEGREIVRSLGGAFIVAEGEGEMPGGGHSSTVMTVGFNPETGRFVGSWAGSMATYLWSYDGWLDETKRVLTLEARGPSFTGDGSTSLYRDCIEIVGPDERKFWAEVQNADGKWRTFMASTYLRSTRAAE